MSASSMQFREFSLAGPFEFLARFAQLGREDRKIERGVHVGFGATGDIHAGIRPVWSRPRLRERRRTR